MGWQLRIWRRLRMLPGVTLNMAKSGPSLTVGPRGAKVTIGRKGIRRTIGLPGTGIYATSENKWASPANSPRAGEAPSVEVANTPRPPHEQEASCSFCGARGVSGQRCPMCNQLIS